MGHAVHQNMVSSRRSTSLYTLALPPKAPPLLALRDPRRAAGRGGASGGVGREGAWRSPRGRGLKAEANREPAPVECKSGNFEGHRLLISRATDGIKGPAAGPLNQRSSWHMHGQRRVGASRDAVVKQGYACAWRAQPHTPTADPPCEGAGIANCGSSAPSSSW